MALREIELVPRRQRASSRWAALNEAGQENPARRWFLGPGVLAQVLVPSLPVVDGAPDPFGFKEGQFVRVHISDHVQQWVVLLQALREAGTRCPGQAQLDRSHGRLGASSLVHSLRLDHGFRPGLTRASQQLGFHRRLGTRRCAPRYGTTSLSEPLQQNLEPCLATPCLRLTSSRSCPRFGHEGCLIHDSLSRGERHGQIVQCDDLLITEPLLHFRSEQAQRPEYLSSRPPAGHGARARPARGGEKGGTEVSCASATSLVLMMGTAIPPLTRIQAAME